jgi:hypothetical protein
MLEPMKSLGHYAYDFEGYAVDSDGFANDGRIG